MRNDHKNCTQITTNGTLTIPEHKPNIDFLLRVTSTPCIDKTVVVDKKVVFSGRVLIGVEYVACIPDCSQPMYFVSFETPFNGFIDHNQVRVSMSIQLKVSIGFQEFQAIDSRTINQLMILKVGILKISKSGESLSPLCSIPYLTVCRQDKVSTNCEPVHHIEYHQDCHMNTCTAESTK